MYFVSYVEALAPVFGDANRAEPLNAYCVGLLMPGDRGSVEPMAAGVPPAQISAKHQSLLRSMTRTRKERAYLRMSLPRAFLQRVCRDVSKLGVECEADPDRRRA